MLVDDTVSFEADILPLFTQIDIEHMDRLKVNLSDYAYMSDPRNDHANAHHVYEVVSIAAQIPGARTGSIEVRPVMKMHT